MAESKKWYVVRVISGQEKKIKDHIKLEISRAKWDEIISEILIPTEKVYTIRNGKKTIKEKNMFPGYIYMEIDTAKINNDILSQIKQVHGVLQYLGTLSHAEALKLLGKADELLDTGEQLAEPFIINEDVKIIDGPFNGFIGSVEEIHNDKKKLKVEVKIFGRKTPVEVTFMQVEKIA
ncbi:MAG: transcription termination/antitermination protein NusG [Chitinophagales bacterium]|nr:transcription termination/antitermination factor NusG [Chitinophagales bacterium]MBX2985006.1 transcription termination/antitermination factor NusG [Bacteroidia bacterium]OJV28887.1 MAG: transcription termination/antitermination factor NusG [Bacteroidetes bacterium 37-13]MCO5280557.1 transcription termination/antitermination protein NusG [Chitinophagales bacterium]HRN95163.1 transcription termination/antitermination protein NusG [Chitinophagales bacterium]